MQTKGNDRSLKPAILLQPPTPNKNRSFALFLIEFFIVFPVLKHYN